MKSSKLIITLTLVILIQGHYFQSTLITQNPRQALDSAENSCSDLFNHPVCLHGGGNAAEGNVYVDGLPVCDDDWDILDADVVCKQLGYTRGALEATTGSHFGQTGSTFSMDDIACMGTEDTIKDCPHEETSWENCGEHEAAGVVCDVIMKEEGVKNQEITEKCFAKDVGYKSEGAMWGDKKVYSAMHCQRWCAENQDCVKFTFHTITKICQRYSVISSNDKVKKDSVVSGPKECLGNPTMIFDNCKTKGNKIICLVNSDNLTNAGNVFINQHPVCDDNWSIADGRFICQEFGYHGIRKTTIMSHFGLVPSSFTQLDDKDGSGANIGCESSEGAGVICDTRDRETIDREKDCFISNLTYAGVKKLNVETNPEYADDCQRDCIKVEDCSHFTWFPEDNKCTLFNRNEMDDGKIEHSQAISGPRVCINDPSITLDPNENCNEENSICLVGGSRNEGNVFVGGKPVCDDHWNIVNAHVACRQKGFVRAIEATSNSRFGNVPQVFALDDVWCTGEETTLSDCSHSPNEDCEGFEAAGVVCDTRDEDDIRNSGQDLAEKCFTKNIVYGNVLNDEVVYVPTPSDCQHYCQQDQQCQLFSYNNKSQECNKRKLMDKHNVVARELPCHSVNINHQSRKDEEVLKRIGSAEECSKKCREKTTCNFWTWHHETSGVWAFDCVLMSGYGYTNSDNNVISGERSCNPGGKDVYERYGAEGVISGPKICADSIVELNSYQGIDCSQPGIACVGGGGGPNEGNVFFGGNPICDENGSWGMTNAHVFCKQMGYTRAKQSKTNSYFGNVTGPFFASNVRCIGNEMSLGACEYIPTPNCLTMEAVGVICETHSQTFEVWLTEQNSYTCLDIDTRYSGSNIPSAKINGHGEKKDTVEDCQAACQEHPECQFFTYFSDEHSSFKYKNICRMLRIKGESQHGMLNHISGPKQCRPCKKFDDFGKCKKYINEKCYNRGEICLIGGSNAREGNVLISGKAVCDDGWDMKDAEVACKQLGFWGALNATVKSKFGRVPFAYGMDEVMCTGHEAELTDCKHRDVDHDCSRGEGAGVICRPNAVALDCLGQNEDCCHPRTVIQDSHMLHTENNHFKPKNVLRDDCDNFNEKMASKTTYWLAPSRQTGVYLILNLGCIMEIDQITLKNTHNGKHNDRGLANFTIWISNSTEGPWISILKDQLKDVQGLGCLVPLENFSLENTINGSRIGQFVKLEVDSFYGNGGGLQYFHVEGNWPDTSTSKSIQLGIGLSTTVFLVASVIALIWVKRKKGSRWLPGTTSEVFSFSYLRMQATDSEESGT